MTNSVNPGSVADFVRKAFPNSTVPYDREHVERDFSSNFSKYDRWDSPQENWCYEPAQKSEERWNQFPPWPADLFAVTASLLERSGGYQRLADSIQPHYKPHSISWDRIVRPENDGTDKDLYGVHNPYRVILRLIGTLWGHGALIISGRHMKEVLLAPAQIMELNTHRIVGSTVELSDSDARIFVPGALGFIGDRLNLEISESDMDSALTSIRYYVLRDVLGIFDDKIVDKNELLRGNLNIKFNKNNSYSPKIFTLSSTAKQAMSCVIDHYFDISENGSIKGKYLEILYDNIDKKIQSYLYIIWASIYLQYNWDIISRSNRPLSVSLTKKGSPDQQKIDVDEDNMWCRAAIRLMIIADEAGKGIGFSQKRKKGMEPPDDPKPKTGSPEPAGEKPLFPPQAGAMCRTIWDYQLREAYYSEPHARGIEFPRTLTRSFDENLGCVLPKARTPSSGCTIRSMSYNFALLPPKGRVRARWARQSVDEERAAYNILLIPYPFNIKSRYVYMNSEPDVADDWGFFKIRPDWLYDFPNGVPNNSSKLDRLIQKPNYDLLDRKLIENLSDSERRKVKFYKLLCHEQLWKFVKSLVDDQPVSTIHAIIFPEGSLDWDAFEFIKNKILDEFDSIEMLVCGVTSAKIRDGLPVTDGNYVATYLRKKKSRADDEPAWAVEHIRAKHHRWKLDSPQLRCYSLSNRLAPDKIWWERINLPPREMLFAEFSSGSVVTTLICEDLARIEPCQVALRAVGPNLVLVLLMDSAQVVGRWPYQYAGVLTDDPGSSVLTLTSFGLIKRSNLSETRESREIAIWREPHTDRHAGEHQKIPLPKGYDAQLLSIRREYCNERTLDGRGNNNDSSIVWRFAGLIPIKSAFVPPGGRADD